MAKTSQLKVILFLFLGLAAAHAETVLQIMNGEHPTKYSAEGHEVPNDPLEKYLVVAKADSFKFEKDVYDPEAAPFSILLTLAPGQKYERVAILDHDSNALLQAIRTGIVDDLIKTISVKDYRAFAADNGKTLLFFAWNLSLGLSRGKSIDIRFRDPETHEGKVETIEQYISVNEHLANEINQKIADGEGEFLKKLGETLRGSSKK